MHVDPIIEPLLRSSKLPVYLEELNAFYAEERQKRESFYAWLNDDVKAEFIEGETVVHSPARNRHIDVTGLIFRLLSFYVDKYDLGSVKSEKALIRLTRNDFEPDICFFNAKKSLNLESDRMFFPTPDFVVEVLSDSTEGRNRGIKFKDYALHGVPEYWIVNAEKEFIEQYFLQEVNEYALHIKANDGAIAARTIPGFTIPVKAVFDKEQNVEAIESLLTK